MLSYSASSTSRLIWLSQSSRVQSLSTYLWSSSLKGFCGSSWFLTMR